MHNYIIDILEMAPFQTGTSFSIEMLWTNFMLIQNSPIDPMLTEDSYQSAKIFHT